MVMKPVKAWAAVATWSSGQIYMDPHSVRPLAQQVREHVGAYFPGGWRGAYQRKWRVVRVEITPASIEPAGRSRRDG